MRLLLLSAALLTAFRPSCGGGETLCTTEARASVSVEVVDASGQAVRDAVVSFTVDGGEARQATCISPSSGAGCERWVTAYEEAGTFVVRATSADGARQKEARLTITQDECHVQGQHVRLTLE